MKNKAALMAASAALAVLIFASEEAVSCCRAALRLCGESIIPALFPFFIISGLLNNLGLPGRLGRLTGRAAGGLFGVSGAGFSAFFMGICGGYPLGAAAAADLNERGIISDSELERLLIFCNNSGPAFIIGAMGAGAMGSAGLGLILYAVHIFSALLSGLLLRSGSGAASAELGETEPMGFSAALCEAVHKGVINTLNVCGFITAFGVFTGLLEAGGFIGALAAFAEKRAGLSPEFMKAFIKGSLELGSGISALKELPLTAQKLALGAFMLSFGSLSVHFQTMALFAEKNISLRPHLAGKLLSASISAAAALIIGKLIL